MRWPNVLCVMASALYGGTLAALSSRLKTQGQMHKWKRALIAMELARPVAAMGQSARRMMKEQKKIDNVLHVCNNANPRMRNDKMSVKVEVKRQREFHFAYPALYIDEQEGLIILLSSAETGTVIDPGRTQYNVGYHGRYWKMDRLVPFLGSVKLENK